MSVPCVECGRESEHSCVCGQCEACGRRKPLARDGMCGEHTDLPDYVDAVESMGPRMVSPTYGEIRGEQ